MRSGLCEGFFGQWEKAVVYDVASGRTVGHHNRVRRLGDERRASIIDNVGYSSKSEAFVIGGPVRRAGRRKTLLNPSVFRVSTTAVELAEEIRLREAVGPRPAKVDRTIGNNMAIQVSLVRSCPADDGRTRAGKFNWKRTGPDLTRQPSKLNFG